MGSATSDAWGQFYERVAAHGESWPRALWFAAVEDAMTQALPADSAVLAEVRAGIAEIHRVERVGRGSRQDEETIGRLEADVRRLIVEADEQIRGHDVEPQAKLANVEPPVNDEPATETAVAAEPEAGGALDAPGEAQDPAGPERRPEPQTPASSESPTEPSTVAPARVTPSAKRGRAAWPGALSAAAAAACVVIVGGMAYYHHRTVSELEGAVAALEQRLTEETAALRDDLVGVDPAAEVQASLSALEAELASKVGVFDAAISEAVLSMTQLGNNVVAEIERRLTEQDDGVTDVLRDLEVRAAELDRGMGAMRAELASLERRLPALDAGVDRLTNRLVASERGFERAARLVATLTAEAPEVALRLERQQRGMEQELGQRRQAIEDLNVSIAALQGELDGTRAHLASLRGDLQPLEAQMFGHRIASGGPEVTAPIAGLEPEPDAIRHDVEQRVDTLLSELAEKADLAVLRSEDVMERARGEAVRRVEEQARAANGDLDAANERHVAELAELATAAKLELQEARHGVLENWERLDQAIAERHDQILADLDRNAEMLDGRVEDFLEALELIVARSEGEEG